MRWPIVCSALILSAGLSHAQEAKDAFGDPLPAGAKVRIGTERFRNLDTYSPVILTPDGATFLAGVNGVLTRYDVKTGLATGTVPGAVTGVPVAISTDGKRAAYVRFDSVVVCDFETGKSVGEVKKKFYYSEGFVSLNADGTRLALGNTVDEKAKDKGVVVSIHDVGGKEPITVKVAQNNSGRVVLSGDGKILATFGYHYEPAKPGEAPDPDENPAFVVQFWDATNGKELSKGKLDVNPLSVAMSRDGSLAAASAGNGSVYLFDTKTGKPSKQLIGRSRIGRQLLFSADGAALAGVADDGSIQIWDVAKGESVGVTECPIANQYNTIRTMVFPVKDRLVALANSGVATVVWEAPSGKRLSLAGGPTQPLSGVAFGKSDEELILASIDPSPLRYGLDGKEIGALALKVPGMTKPSASFSPLSIARDGATAYRADSGEFAIFDLGTGVQKCAIPANYGANIAFSADGKRAAFGTPPSFSNKPKPGKISLVDLDKKLFTATLTLPDGVPVAIGFTGHGKHVGVFARVQKGKDPAALMLYGIDLGTSKVVSEAKFAEAYGNQYLVGVPGTDSLLVVHPSLGMVELDLSTGKTTREFVKGFNSVTAAPVFAPDGKSVAYTIGSTYGSGPAEVLVRDWESAKVAHKFGGHTRAANALAFSKSGKLLASASADSTALVWDLTKAKE